MTAQIHELLILARTRRQKTSMAFCPPLPHHLDVISDAPNEDEDAALGELVYQTFDHEYKPLE